MYGRLIVLPICKVTQADFRAFYSTEPWRRCLSLGRRKKGVELGLPASVAYFVVEYVYGMNSHQFSFSFFFPVGKQGCRPGVAVDSKLLGADRLLILTKCRIQTVNMEQQARNRQPVHNYSALRH